MTNFFFFGNSYPERAAGCFKFNLTNNYKNIIICAFLKSYERKSRSITIHPPAQDPESPCEAQLQKVRRKYRGALLVVLAVGLLASEGYNRIKDAISPMPKAWAEFGETTVACEERYAQDPIQGRACFLSASQTIREALYAQELPACIEALGREVCEEWIPDPESSSCDEDEADIFWRYQPKIRPLNIEDLLLEEDDAFSKRPRSDRPDATSIPKGNEYKATIKKL